MVGKKRFIASKTMIVLFFYLLLPLLTLLLMIKIYPELPPESIYMRIYWIIPSAVIIVLFTHLSTQYQKGETKRFLLNIGFTTMTLCWMFGLLGGNIVITEHWKGYEFSLHMDKYLLLILTMTILNVIYYIFEWWAYNKKKGVHSTNIFLLDK